MHAARAGRKIDKQEVQPAPFGLVDHLAQGVGRHGVAPDQCVGGFNEEADRHEFDTHRVGRQDAILAVDAFGIGQITLHAEHFGLRRSVNVGVEDAHAVTHVAQRERQIGRDGRFAHAALARCDGQHLADTAREGMLRCRRRRFRRGFSDDDGDVFPVEGELSGDGLLDLAFDLHGEGVARLFEPERDGHAAFAGVDMLHHAALDDVPPAFGVDDA